MDVKSLTQVNNIQEVIKQVQQGEVKAICEHYCPKSRKDPSNPTWNNIKKMQYHVGDDSTTSFKLSFVVMGERFFAIATLTSPSSSKRKQTKGQEELCTVATEDAKINLMYGSWHQNREGTT